MYKLLTSARRSDDLFIGFHRSRDNRKQELTNNKIIKGKYQVSIHLRDVFRFAQKQEKGTAGLGYKLTSTRNTDNAFLSKDNALKNAEVKINLSHGIFRDTHLVIKNKIC